MPGANVTEQCSAFATQAEKYRLAYWGVTGYLDAPALSNQGTVVAAQYPLESRRMYAFAGNPDITRQPMVRGKAAAAQSGPDSVVGLSPDSVGSEVQVFVQEPRAFDMLQSMPNSYMGLAKDGFYAPGRLMPAAYKWRNAQDRTMVMGFSDAINYAGPNGAGIGIALLPATGDAGAPCFVTGVSQAGAGGLWTRRCQDGVIEVCGRNLSGAANVTLFFRYGFEMQVLPGSSISAFQHLAPKYDAVSLQAVSAIQRELKDAYPSEYNDLSKLLGVIRDALSVVPHPIAQVLSTVAGVVSGGVGLLSKLRSEPGRDKDTSRATGKTNVRDKPPAAVVEAANAATHAAAVSHDRAQMHSRAHLVPKARPRVRINPARRG